MSCEAVTEVFVVRKIKKKQPFCPKQLVDIRTVSCLRREQEKKEGMHKTKETVKYSLIVSE